MTKTDRAARVWNEVTHQHNSSQLRPHLNRNTLGVTLERQQHVQHMHRLSVSAEAARCGDVNCK